ncbi:MAG: HEAT repeat domain-containing protein [Candidatus Omnitrophica bacterium]|nr:HEAT repeat domain-containing protein [Candidatus Omnitrophota bacterium]
MINSPLKKDSGRKLFFGLFIFPLLIAVGMAVLLCTVVLLTREVETPESLIMAIKTGSPSKRWQKAFELSNELNQGRGMIRSEGVMKEIIHILTEREEYDIQTRSYMAIALSRFEEPEVVSVLREALKAEPEPEVQLHLIWGLGIRGAKEAVDDILPYLKSEREDIRKMAVYVLGVLQDKKAAKPLENLLDDESRDVRWNAALSLARLGSDAGYPVLVKMLDREALKNYEGLPEDKIEEIMVNATKGMALLGRSDSLTILNQLAKGDSSLKVRQAALEALQYQNQKVR